VNTDAILPFVTSQISLWGKKGKIMGLAGEEEMGGEG